MVGRVTSVSWDGILTTLKVLELILSTQTDCVQQRCAKLEKYAQVMGVKARSISCCLVRRTWRQKERKNKRGLRGVNTACLVHTARGIPADVLPLMLTSSALALWVPDQTQIGLQTISSGCPKIHAGKTCSRLPWSAVVGRRVLRNFTYKLSRLITLGCSRLINYQSDRQAQSENLSGIGTY